MYFISLPLLDMTRKFSLTYTERFEMNRKSLSFQLCTYNTILGYLLLLMELTWFVTSYCNMACSFNEAC